MWVDHCEKLIMSSTLIRKACRFLIKRATKHNTAWRRGHMSKFVEHGDFCSMATAAYRSSQPVRCRGQMSSQSVTMTDDRKTACVAFDQSQYDDTTMHIMVIYVACDSEWPHPLCNAFSRHTGDSHSNQNVTRTAVPPHCLLSAAVMSNSIWTDKRTCDPV